MICEKTVELFGERAIGRVGLIFTVAQQVGKTFEQEFGVDANAKNAGIDLMVELLLKQKAALPAAAPAA